MSTPTNLCVFCGEIPKQKTKEHILPQWLLRETETEQKGLLHGTVGYPFKGFILPACYSCNNIYSALEAQAQRVVNLIQSAQFVSAHDIDALLDWLDKVRIGLWLHGRAVSRNARNINPNFHINQRMGRKDRILRISRFKHARPALSFIGTETEAFHFSPSCFGLIINELCLINASWDGALKGCLGGAFLKELKQTISTSNVLEATISDGCEFISPVPFRDAFIGSGVFFAQEFFGFHNSDGNLQVIRNKFSDQDALDADKGRGAIFTGTSLSSLKRIGIKDKIDSATIVQISSQRTIFIAEAEVLRLQRYSSNIAKSPLLEIDGIDTVSRRDMATEELDRVLHSMSNESAANTGFYMNLRASKPM
jgi:hypothetical protein